MYTVSERSSLTSEKKAVTHNLCTRVHRYSWVVECRSHVEHGARPTSTIYMQMYNNAGRGQAQGNQIRVTLPYVRVDIPVIIVFRALGEGPQMHTST